MGALVGHVDAELGRRDKVLPGALRDDHARLLVEDGRHLGRRRLRRDGHVLLEVLTAPLEVVRHVAVLPQEGEELQQEVAEVLADAEPPCGRDARFRLVRCF